MNSLRFPARICSALGKLCSSDILRNVSDSLLSDVQSYGLNRMSIVHCVHIGLTLSARISLKFIAYETLARRIRRRRLVRLVFEVRWSH